MSLLDLRQSWRAAWRERGTSAIAISLLALGIGAASAVFTVVDTLFWKPSPIEDPSNLAVMWRFDKEREVPFSEVSFPDYLDWRRDNESFEDIACFGAANHGGVLHLDEPYGLVSADVSVSFFDVLGARTEVGRTFRPDEGAASSTRVVVLSYGLWQRLFAGDPGVVGRKIRIRTLGSFLYEVIGVMPEAFDFPRNAELWRPLRRNERVTKIRNLAYLFLIGRLAPDTTYDEAKAEMDGLIAATDRTHNPDRDRRDTAAVHPFLDYYLGFGTRPALWAISGAVVLVLVIAWINVGNLVLVRAGEEERERAIRYALGASRGDVLRRTLLDSSLLALAGTVVGTVVTTLFLLGVRRFDPGVLPRAEALSVNVGLLGALGVVSALVITSFAAARIVRDGREAVARNRSRHAVLAGQVAIAVVVLAGCALTLRSFMSLVQTDPGYQTERLLMFNYAALDDAYPTRDDKRTLHRTAIERVRHVPGVLSAAGIVNRPFVAGSVGWDATFVYEGQAFGWREVEEDGETYHIPRYSDFNENPTTNWQVVTPGYFETMSIEILEGRDFRDSDDSERPHVVIVSQNLAERLWPGESAIGKGLLGPGSRFDDDRYMTWSRIVGVVENTNYREIDSVRYDMYHAHAQGELPLKSLVVRTAAEPYSLLPAIRRELRTLDPTIPLSRVAALDHVVSDQRAPWRFNAALFAAFAAVASFMTALGIFGVVARSVTDRRREIGIRMAVGARPREVVRLLVDRAMRPALAGVVAGLAMAVLLSRFLAALLYEVSPTDPTTYVGVAGLFVLVALLASYAPARQAAAIDPMVTLRHE